ncbi:MAG: NAD(+) synthase [Acidobacteriota bacterium]|nr:MAG: NAD(+) synthase [Acidobacteriota bacterium]
MEFRVSIAQINPKSGDIKGNSRLILQGIDQAREQAADLVVFPEMCLTGYCLDEKLLFNRTFLRDNKRILLEEIVPACKGIAAIIGFVDFEEEGSGPDSGPIRYNAAMVVDDRRVSDIVHKRLLPSYRYFDDKRYFKAGSRVEPILLGPGGKVRIGVLICEDLWDEKYDFKPAGVYAEKGVDYLFCINASPFVCSSPGLEDGKRFQRSLLIRSHVEAYGVPIVSVNTVGIGDNGKNIIPFDGFSSAHDRRGQQVACLASFAPDQQTVTFNGGVASPVEVPVFEREQEIYDALVMGVRDYYDKTAAFTGVLEAVSGGIDSALGAAIACDAMGAERVSLYNLPSKFNSETTQTAAAQLARNFGTEYHVVPIQDLVDQAVRDFESHLHPMRSHLTLENLQARIRGVIMMAESNDREALLLTNGNETEIALGYATLYGDMVGGLAVIGDLPKPDVYRVSRYVNRRWGREMIPRAIFEIPASAELSEGQVDPFDYSVVGPMVSDFIEKNISPEVLADQFERRELNLNKYEATEAGDLYTRYDRASFLELARKTYRTMTYSAYKRVQAAPIIVVSERAFGFDLRETIINGWR